MPRLATLDVSQISAAAAGLNVTQVARQQAQTAMVKFVGTHAQYDRIDVENVNDY